MTKAPKKTNWEALYEIASAQSGFFTTTQAAHAGYSPQLLVHYVRVGRVTRARRGIYRLVHFPRTDHEELVLVWLWSEQMGLVSHQTVLALNDLSDLLPTRTHLTLPTAWKRRRLRVPRGVALHYSDVSTDDRAWFGAVPTTSIRRALIDCANDGLDPDLLRQATQQALRRGLVSEEDVAPVVSALAPFGGLAA